ncbi:hypothetical protein [Nostoc sp.]|uniref:hypothetical protein n=1 Tax=Nostoc sp. TaxID=1180 RepID=UPI002FF8A0F5
MLSCGAIAPKVVLSSTIFSPSELLKSAIASIPTIVVVNSALLLVSPCQKTH